MENNKKRREEKLIAESDKILEKFTRIAEGINLKKEHKINYVNIIRREDKIIGCIKYHYNNSHFKDDVEREDRIIFEFHSTHPRGRERKPINDLKDEEIKDIILRTPGTLIRNKRKIKKLLAK